MKQIGTILTASLLALLAACQQESDLVVSHQGEILLTLTRDVVAYTEVETRATQTIATADMDEFSFTITGESVENEHYSNTPLTFAKASDGVSLRTILNSGTYTLHATSCTEEAAEVGWGKPRYEGSSSEFFFDAGETAYVTLPFGKAVNARIQVTYDENFIRFYEGATIVLSEGSRSLTDTYDGVKTNSDFAYFNIPASGTRTVNYTLTAAARQGSMVWDVRNAIQGTVELVPGRSSTLTISVKEVDGVPLPFVTDTAYNGEFD